MNKDIFYGVSGVLLIILVIVCIIALFFTFFIKTSFSDREKKYSFCEEMGGIPEKVNIADCYLLIDGKYLKPFYVRNISGEFRLVEITR